MQARLQRLTFEEVRDSVAIIGTAEHCIERIRWLQAEFQLSELISWFNPGGLMPQRTVLASMDRFAALIVCLGQPWLWCSQVVVGLWGS